MSAGEFLDLEGHVSRRCPKCGVTIAITRPPRPLSHTTGARARKHLGAELKRQVMWELTCEGPEGCRSWWNNAVKRCERGLSERREV